MEKKWYHKLFGKLVRLLAGKGTQPPPGDHPIQRGAGSYPFKEAGNNAAENKTKSNS